MSNKTIIRFCFCDIQNNRGLGKGYQLWVSADNSYLDLDYSGYHKNLIQQLFIIADHCSQTKCSVPLKIHYLNVEPAYRFKNAVIN